MTRFIYRVGCYGICVAMTMFGTIRANAYQIRPGGSSTLNDCQTPTQSPLDEESKSRTSRSISKQAKTSLDNGQSKEAEQLAIKSIGLDKFNEDGWLVLAQAYEQQGKVEKCLEAYREIIYRGHGGEGNTVTTITKFMLSLLKARQWNEAVLVYDRIRLGKSETTKFGTSQELPLRSIGFDVRKENYSQMQALGYLILGSVATSFVEVYDDDKRKAVEIEYLKKSLSLAPSLGLTHFWYGKKLYEAHKLAEAKPKFEKAVLLSPELGCAHFYLAMTAWDMDQTFLAPEFEKAIKLTTGDLHDKAVREYDWLVRTSKKPE